MIGPSRPDAAPIAGPQLPPPPVAGPSRPSAPAEPDSDDDDDFMPALPPELMAARKQPADAGASKGAVKASIGPSLPPGFQRNRSASPPSRRPAYPAEDSDDEAGPMPAPAAGVPSAGLENEGVTAIREREERAAEKERLERENKKPKREEWMLLPPKEGDIMASVDPTKLKSRGFRQTAKPHAGQSTDRSAGPSTLWTETPAERAKRMEDEVMGKRKRIENAEEGGEEGEEDRRRKKRDQEMREKVESHNKASRNASLLEMYSQASSSIEGSKSAAQKAKEKKEEVIWDREKMMGVGGKLMGEKEKQDMFKDARGLGGRFGGGSFL